MRSKTKMIWIPNPLFLYHLVKTTPPHPPHLHHPPPRPFVGMPEGWAESTHGNLTKLYQNTTRIRRKRWQEEKRRSYCDEWRWDRWWGLKTSVRFEVWWAKPILLLEILSGRGDDSRIAAAKIFWGLKWCSEYVWGFIEYRKSNIKKRHGAADGMLIW